MLERRMHRGRRVHSRARNLVNLIDGTGRAGYVSWPRVATCVPASKQCNLKRVRARAIRRTIRAVAHTRCAALIGL